MAFVPLLHGLAFYTDCTQHVGPCIMWFRCQVQREPGRLDRLQGFSLRQLVLSCRHFQRAVYTTRWALQMILNRLHRVHGRLCLYKLRSMLGCARLAMRLPCEIAGPSVTGFHPPADAAVQGG